VNTGRPDSKYDLAIVGAGVVGLSIAVLARSEGLRVAVIDHGKPGGGASRGNAGWVTPTVVEPLPSPASIREALRRPGGSKALRLSPRVDRDFIAFSARFIRYSRRSHFQSGRLALGTLGLLTEEATADLERAGVPDARSNAGLLVVAASPQVAARAHEDLQRHAERLGTDSVGPLLRGDALYAVDPNLGAGVRVGFELRRDHFIDPSQHVDNLVETARRKGVCLVTDQRDVRLAISGDRISGIATTTSSIQAENVVVSAGYGSASVLRTAGLRFPLIAGNGYSLTVHGDAVPRHALDAPEQHIALTPMNGGLRVVGRMELSRNHQHLRPGAIRALVEAGRRLLPELEWSRITHQWTGPRPLTGDGLPLIGRSRIAPGLLLATGHGMWGVTLAAATARAMVDELVERAPQIDLSPFDPDRLISRWSQVPFAGPESALVNRWRVRPHG
jgi:D-amino-acid dehydrogenase